MVSLKVEITGNVLLTTLVFSIQPSHFESEVSVVLTVQYIYYVLYVSELLY